MSELPPLSTMLASYALAVTVVSFFYIGRDKEHARHGGTRTPEAVLWFLAAIGGTPGILLGMRFFHHKTKKNLFSACAVSHFARSARLDCLFITDYTGWVILQS
ncbi:MAG: hypothetical protein CO030_00555 [Candidatus Magasanikbacteria bacterium CG_4_9_14_0_2_um_filter_42_11]|uniref:DUF1294 domain-containing protein n=1 Tax=Candidatus Magasanikbacteria bacterium CG_4_9_14_0_2_um_filter_42_11 TaxID=1974643 RepID=A0A2M8FAW7_9BACT|nr:MAG: hypothetical protein COU34_02870 [Candidatus Magasanikbacteria bacterium CG10_big_fil_rev_8_21_14_0_10_43_9]PIY92421.1 MAG: hypothetical protein COY70_03360 [Candidatus Magasanikbacteria bacterium CG_4_10_14_0_8_um_filter_42_12]PJC52883.1 MAG: hypothetical protein CO030_00555 [Candidatus Magasanikbacteria bacterium CG_4_9_14_0_2_um_filter_42_11]